MRIIRLVALLVALPAILEAQGPTPSLIRSAQRARELLRRGIEAAGGLNALRGVTTVTRVMNGRRTDIGQGLTPDRPADLTNTSVVIVDPVTPRLARWTRAVILGGQPIRWHFAINQNGGFNANFGNRTIRSVPAPNARNVLAGNIRRWPETLLLAAWNRPEALRLLDPDVVAYADIDGTVLNLVFEPRSGLLRRIEWAADDAVRGEGTSAIRFEDWRPAGNLRLPYRYTEEVLGSDLQSYTVTSLTINAPVPDSAFAAPAGLDTIPSTDGGPPERLGTGVWMSAGAYTSLAVEFRDYVLVLEAGGSSVSAQSQLAQFRRLVPGKPIRYVVTTHAHHDHVSGVRPYIAEGVTIVTTPDAAAVVRAAARSTHVFRADTLSRAPRDPVVELVTDRRVFDDSTQRLELYQIGPSPHARQILVAYLPRERLLFEGDLLDLSYGHANAGGEDTEHLASSLQQLGLVVDRIVAVHSGVGPRALLDSALAQRARWATSSR